MSKYSEIEIQTAKKLHDAGYKWLSRDKSGGVYAYSGKPYKSDGCWVDKDIGRLILVVGKFTQIFQGIKWKDNEPTYIEDILNPQILDEVERRYLERVLRPLPRVSFIEKSATDDCREYLTVVFRDGEGMELPFFPEGTMYKGMELDVHYFPKELGLKLKEDKA